LKYLVSFAALICAIFIWIGGVNAVEYDENLVIYFDYEEFQGDTVINRAVNGHHGKINGDVKQDAAGKRGNAASFETGSFIDLDGKNFPAEDIPTSNFTLCAWIKCENTGGDHAVFNARAADSTWLIHPDIRSGGEYRLCLRGNGGIKICDMKVPGVVWNEWTHYAGTYDKSDKAILYINGEVVGEEIQAKEDIAGDWGQGARVGYNMDDKRPFTGLMDDLCVWKKTLSQDEIKALMENGPEPMTVSKKGKVAVTWGKIKR
jgi:hypothetical protein